VSPNSDIRVSGKFKACGLVGQHHRICVIKVVIGMRHKSRSAVPDGNTLKRGFEKYSALSLFVGQLILAIKTVCDSVRARYYSQDRHGADSTYKKSLESGGSGSRPQ
jgi:hypothetical protein